MFNTIFKILIFLLFLNINPVYSKITNNTDFNFGVPSSADILFFEEEEIIDIEALIEEIIAEMDAEDDSTATSPSEE